MRAHNLYKFLHKYMKHTHSPTVSHSKFMAFQKPRHGLAVCKQSQNSKSLINLSSKKMKKKLNSTMKFKSKNIKVEDHQEKTVENMKKDSNLTKLKTQNTYSKNESQRLMPRYVDYSQEDFTTSSITIYIYIYIYVDLSNTQRMTGILGGGFVHSCPQKSVKKNMQYHLINERNMLIKDIVLTQKERIKLDCFWGKEEPRKLKYLMDKYL